MRIVVVGVVGEDVEMCIRLQHYGVQLTVDHLLHLVWKEIGRRYVGRKHMDPGGER
jgi:hypothetical protein